MDLGGRRLRQGREVEAMPNLDSSRLTRAAQREQLDLIQALNQAALRDSGGSHEGIEGMIRQLRACISHARHSARSH